MARIETSQTQVRRRTILAAVLLVAAAAAAGPVLADPDLADVQVVDRDTGQILPVWSHHGRLFVAGAPGARYSLRVTNHTGGRVLVVLSVDGINIISGQTADYDQRGYVFDPYQTFDLSGWRKSRTEVAAFSFAPLPQSYAARTGRPADVGVIGMAVFRERAPIQPLVAESRAAPAPWAPWGHASPLALPPPPPLVAPAAPPAARSASEAVETGSRVPRRDFDSNAATEKLGTAHGPREWSISEVVSFVRATPYPQSVRQIEYDTYANLVARGVIPRGEPEQHRPRAFPRAPRGEGYVPDPPDER